MTNPVPNKPVLKRRVGYELEDDQRRKTLHMRSGDGDDAAMI
jgi:hypothetical protein